MYYRISKNEKNLFFGKKIAQVWAVTLNAALHVQPFFAGLVINMNINSYKATLNDNGSFEHFFCSQPQLLNRYMSVLYICLFICQSVCMSHFCVFDVSSKRLIRL